MRLSGTDGLNSYRTKISRNTLQHGYALIVHQGTLFDIKNHIYPSSVAFKSLERRSLCFGGVLQASYLFTYLNPIPGLYYFFSAIAGIGSSFIWITMGTELGVNSTNDTAHRYHLITQEKYLSFVTVCFFQKYMHLLGFLYVWKFIRKYLCILHLGRSWPCQRLITGIMFTLSTRIWFTFYCWYNIIPGDLKSNGIVEKIWNPIIRIPINAPDFAKLMFEL